MSRKIRSGTEKIKRLGELADAGISHCYLPNKLALVWYLKNAQELGELIVAPNETDAISLTDVSGRLGWAIGRLQSLPDWETSRESYIEAIEQNLKIIQEWKNNQTNLCLSAENLFEPIPKLGVLAELEIGQTVDLRKLIGSLVQAGYENQARVFQAGEYSLRGDTLDIGIATLGNFRIELFGNQIESISHYDTMDNRRGEKVKRLDVLALRLSAGDTNWLSAKPDSLVIVYQPERLSDKWLIKQAGDAKQLDKVAHLFVHTIKQSEIYDLGFRLLKTSKIKDEIKNASKVFVATTRPLLIEKWFHNEQIDNLPEIYNLSQEDGDGFVWETTGDLMLTTTDFGIKTGKDKSIKPKLLLSDFVIGDFVVHLEHGVGQVESIAPQTVAGITREYLIIKYAEKDKLYLPADQLDKVVKYISPDGTAPKLSRLHTEHWQNTLKKIKKDTLEYAKKLLELYAERSIRQGVIVQPDQASQKLLDETFAYELTPDQKKALADILADLARPTPMDRLLTADVGFGKTEVALRAALQAVQNGFQVALLAPTTILAEQHGKVFSERLRQFGVEVATLSRFRSPQEQKSIIENLKKNQIDIVIGTHRLLQKDVQFANLGFVIIDEEQRFGVKHKEHLKLLRKNINVLSMTATPIPRTLHLAMAGLRDLSVIETPPQERKPIITKVMEFDWNKVVEAVTNEIKRDGQVYIIYNQVKTIDSFANKLAKLIPEVEISVAHAQMSEKMLKARMTEFELHKSDILLASTIIENGIDNPNVNTLLVINAEHFGLSQLHQLRGRIGRGKIEAFGYFLYRPGSLTADAVDRLEALAEHSGLGEGKEIALRDLQIRGSGGILSTRQSGHARMIGLSLYNKLMNQAVEELQSGRKITVDSVTIDLPVDVYIPESYIADDNQRLDWYQKIAQAETDELGIVESTLISKFGAFPVSVANLINIAKLRSIALESQIIQSISYRETSLNGLTTRKLELKKIDGEIIKKLVRAGERNRIIETCGEFIAEVISQT